MEIPEAATAVHGITNAQVRRAPDLLVALADLRRLCKHRTVVAHSAHFDLSFLGPTVATRALCTMRLARAVFPEAPNHKNQTLRDFLAIDTAVKGRLEAHRALDDAIVTAHILLACRRDFRRRAPHLSWADFLDQSGSYARVPQLVPR
jgi:DNA polymerase III epsilon subunit-like protein